MSTPLVSVILPMYNCQRYVREAVQSSLDQTFRDFELLIIDDGSTDRGPEVIKDFGDNRVRMIRNGHNLGLVTSLNRGIENAVGKYVARMDADDINMPERLAKQVAVMEAHPEISILGTQLSFIDSEGGVPAVEPWNVPTEPLELRWLLSFSCCVNHPTVMARKKILARVGGYRQQFRHAEDYDLWLRCATVSKIANLPDVCLRYRIHSRSVSVNYRDAQIANSDRAVQEALCALLGKTVTLRLVRNLRNFGEPIEVQDAVEISQLLLLLYRKLMAGVASQTPGFTTVREDLTNRLLRLAKIASISSPGSAASIVMKAFRTNPDRVAKRIIGRVFGLTRRLALS